LSLVGKTMAKYMVFKEPSNKIYEAHPNIACQVEVSYESAAAQ
jgi:hypothetical protein